MNGRASFIAGVNIPLSGDLQLSSENPFVKLDLPLLRRHHYILDRLIPTQPIPFPNMSQRIKYGLLGTLIRSPGLGCPCCRFTSGFEVVPKVALMLLSAQLNVLDVGLVSWELTG